MTSYLAHLLKQTSAATLVVQADPLHELLLPNYHLKVLQSQVLWLAAHCMFPVQLLSPVKYLGMNMKRTSQEWATYFCIYLSLQYNYNAFTTGIMI
jgi:hypothetical protein